MARPSKEDVIAIFDLRKTEKSFILFNRDYELVHEELQIFDKIADDDGEESQNLEALGHWMRRMVLQTLSNKALDLQAMNFNAFGASWVHLDAKGKVATPAYDNFRPLPAGVIEKFEGLYGSLDQVALDTSSPKLGMQNAGMQLFWLKHFKPDQFKKIKFSLAMPQYCSYLFTGKPFTEITSMGCHTMLWDFQKDYSHQWVYKEKLVKLFPPLVNTYNTQNFSYRGKVVPCGIGIHDDSAALVPYLMGVNEDFALISSGSWNVTFNPKNTVPLTSEELNRDCLRYLTYLGKPVKASRVWMGHEHNVQERKMARYFAQAADYHRQMKLDVKLLKKVAKDSAENKKFYPASMKGTGPFPQEFKQTVDLGQFESYEEAYHKLCLDLAWLQLQSTRLVLKGSPVRKVFLAGGFSDNDIFLKVLATLMPDIEFYTATISRAAALGTSLVIQQLWNRQQTTFDLFDFYRIWPVEDADLSRYQLIKK